MDLRYFHFDWSFEVPAGPFGHHLGALTPKTSHRAEQHSTSHPWTNSASLAAGTQGLPLPSHLPSFDVKDEDLDIPVNNGQCACGAVGTNTTEDITATARSHCALRALTVACLLSGGRGSRAVEHHRTIQTPHLSIHGQTPAMEHHYRRSGMLNRPMVGEPFFFNLFCRSVEVSDGRAAGNVALRVDEAVMRGIKLHGRGKLVPGRRIETPDAASERHPSRSVLDLLLLLLVLSFR